MKKMMCAVIVLVVCLWSETRAAIWYVAPPPLGSNKNPGTQEYPFATIQRGIDAAGNGDTVIVAEGTYVENINFKGKNIVLTSTDPLNWDVVGNTVIDANKSGSVVTFFGTENETCVLSGFTIRNGTGTLAPGESGPALHGGGIIGADPVAIPWGTSFARATIQNNVVTGNSADNGGGLCVCMGLTRNNIIIGNWSLMRSSDHCGGGIGFCNGTIENNLIVGNSAGCGGAMSFSNVDFRNNVVVGNTTPFHGGGPAHVATSTYTPPGGSISNCIIWGNTSPTGPQVHESVAPSHCCIQDWTGGGDENITVNPQFVDPDGPDNDPATFEDNDYHLLPGSPCIDNGKKEDWMVGAVDLDGNPRILAGISSLTVDMGTYEYRFCIGGIRMAPPTGGPELSWKSGQRVRYAVWSCTDLCGGSWNTEATVTSAGELTTWTDPDTACILKFYRVEIK
jgi:hypothetical protein